MTTPTCDRVAERVALGEPLAELAEHAASCDGCRSLAAMPGQLAATHHEIDPGLGFSARMTVGAQHRLVVRRRRRLAVGLAASVAAGSLGVMVATHQPDQQATAGLSRPTTDPGKPAPAHDPAPAPSADEAELAALVQLADVERARRVAAPWGRIEQPLAAYRTLIKGDLP